MSAVITGKNYLVTKLDRYNKYQTKQYAHTHTFTLHTQQLVAIELGWVTTKEDHPLL